MKAKAERGRHPSLWGLRFLRECSARRAQANARRILALARAGLDELKLLS